MANAVGQLVDVVGTRLNLPEWNISEKLGGGNTVNTVNYQYAHGDNPYSWRQQSYYPDYTNSPSGQNITWNTVNSQGSLQPTNSSAQKITPDEALKTGQDINELRKNGLLNEIVPSIDPLIAEIDRAFGERMGRLNNIASILQGQFPLAQQEANQQFGAQKATLDAGRAGSEREIAAAESDASLRKTDAMSDARRQYNDLIRGGVQRFGGASTAGQAFSEIAATEAQKQFGNIRQTYDTAVQKINDFKMGLQERYSAGLLQLQAVRDRAINDARRSLDQSLLQIEQMKGEAEDAKSQRRLAVLQDYRSNIFNVNSMITQWKLGLDQEYQAGQQEVAQANALFSQYATGAGDTAGGVPVNANVDVSMSPISATSQSPTQYIGQIQSPKRYDQLIAGSLNPREDVLQSARNAFGTLTA